MAILVTGSSGHLGEALIRVLQGQGRACRGLDVVPSAFTDVVGSVSDTEVVARAMAGINAVIHTATLHKPHVVTHDWPAFVDTNITGTARLLEAAAGAGVSAFVYTSTTSVFGHAMRPATGAPAVWVTEALQPHIKNIYGATKRAAEDLVRLCHQERGVPCVILRTARFFPEADDNPETRNRFGDINSKVNEFLNRRVEVSDVVSAHLHACARARDIGSGTYIVSATTPFRRGDVDALRHDPVAVIARDMPQVAGIYRRLGWRFPDSLDRVYDNSAARDALGWEPEYDFGRAVDLASSTGHFQSALASRVGIKGYHDTGFDDGPYPVR